MYYEYMCIYIYHVYIYIMCIYIYIMYICTHPLVIQHLHGEIAMASHFDVPTRPRPCGWRHCDHPGLPGPRIIKKSLHGIMRYI